MTSKSKKTNKGVSVSVCIQEITSNNKYVGEEYFINREGKIKQEEKGIPEIPHEDINEAVKGYLTSQELKLLEGTVHSELVCSKDFGNWRLVIHAVLKDPNYYRVLFVQAVLGTLEEITPDEAAKDYDNIVIDLPVESEKTE